MGKTFRKQNPREEKPLSQRPFAQLRTMKVGPTCLKCGEPVDTRPARSITDPRGSPAMQRQGYLHEKCLTESEHATALSSNNNFFFVPGRDEKGKRITRRLEFIKVTEGKENKIEVPTMTEEEINARVAAITGEDLT